MASLIDFDSTGSSVRPAKSAARFDELPIRARRGCPAALGQLLQMARKYLLTVASNRLDAELRSKLGAPELVQETFVDVQRGFARFRGTTEQEFLAWLSIALHHRCLDATRHYCGTLKRAISKEVPPVAAEMALEAVTSESPTPATNLIALEERRRLTAAINQLPTGSRDLILLRVWQQAPFAEIGERLGCTAEAARKRFFRAVEEMQAHLESAGPKL
jgi:RNA polymerase sigma-70 factor (ECF subfamily)